MSLVNVSTNCEASRILTFIHRRGKVAHTLVNFRHLPGPFHVIQLRISGGNGAHGRNSGQ